MSGQHDGLPRDILPIPDRELVGLTTDTATEPDHTISPAERFQLATARR